MEDLLVDRLTLSRWRQFNEIDIEFHDRLTVLTGANGAGKSTILKILKCHFPYESDEKFLATPIREKESIRFSPGNWLLTKFDEIFRPLKPVETDQQKVGQVTYSSKNICSLSVPASDTMQYTLNRSLNQEILGVSIRSHRPPPKYDQLKHIPVSGVSPREAFQFYFELEKANAEQSVYHRDGVWVRMNPLAALKEAIISFATFGVGNEHVKPVPELAGLYKIPSNPQ
ncbi:AAA family ATPase [Shinella sp.]|uniref:AAA family ATPase n=1 Tax=Shinella sp. TaxID=1870904 RepID=UPI0029AD552F|nr:AAA family ATPase [Shinella sp.]MDX3978786.1 AAA family ATPase [Shinella sp.]